MNTKGSLEKGFRDNYRFCRLPGVYDNVKYSKLPFNCFNWYRLKEHGISQRWWWCRQWKLGNNIFPQYMASDSGHTVDVVANKVPGNKLQVDREELLLVRIALLSHGDVNEYISRVYQRKGRGYFKILRFTSAFRIYTRYALFLRPESEEEE